MVRAIVGTLVDVGRGRWAPEFVQSLLDGGHRGDAGATAPAHGLFLVRVDYH
jgi:tRNA pseudouridine38-40 synthase